MIKIQKSDTIPAPINGVAAPGQDDTIDPAIYGADEVKAQLLEDQHYKCAYCECLLNGDFGDVEHFRPKKGYTTPQKTKLTRPGYYWLAYNWSNLLVACSTCNRTYKKNHFALADEAGRNIKGEDITNEEPLFINPAEEDPADHIKFHEHILAPRSSAGISHDRAEYTISTLKLNDRPQLVGNRRRVWEAWTKLHRQRSIAKHMLNNGIETALATELDNLVSSQIATMQSPDAEYASMLIHQG